MDSRSALPRKNRRWRRLRIVKRDELFSPYFFLSEGDLIALESGLTEDPGGDHPEGRARGIGRALVGGGPPGVLLQYFFVPVFLINSTKNPPEVSWHLENFYFCTKTTPW
jgi:hypothetical protein